jgi:peptide deformylase
MSSSEKSLIHNGSANVPFRILQTNHYADSLTLRSKSEPFNFQKDSTEIALFTERLKITMIAAQGVGIAAPQVGILRNIFVFVRTDKSGYPIETVINPHIIAHSDETICFEHDGCLSVPDQSGISKRYKWIEVEYQDERGKIIRETIRGYSATENFAAVIFQHEFDHLSGILYIDKLCQ